MPGRKPKNRGGHGTIFNNLEVVKFRHQALVKCGGTILQVRGTFLKKTRIQKATYTSTFTLVNCPQGIFDRLP